MSDYMREIRKREQEDEEVSFREELEGKVVEWVKNADIREVIMMLERDYIIIPN